MTLTEKTMSITSRFRASAVKLAAMLSHKRKSSQESHSNRDGTPLAHRAGQGENEALSRLSESEKWYEIISWRAKKSVALRGKIWNTEAGMQSREGWLCFSWTSKTNSVQSYGNWPWQKLKYCELTNSPGMSWEKVSLLQTSSPPKYRSCRNFICIVYGGHVSVCVCRLFLCWRQSASSHAHFTQPCQGRAQLSTFDLCTRTRVWLKTWSGLVAQLRTLKVIHSHSMFHRPLFEVLDPFPPFVPRHLRRHGTHCSWLVSGDLPVPLRQEDCCVASGWINSPHRLWAQHPASTSAVSTRRSSTPRGETASTSRTTTLPPQSRPPRTPTVFSSKRQPVVACSMYQQVWETHGFAPTCGPAPWNLCEVISQLQVLKGLCPKEKEIEIWNVRRLCLNLEQKAETAVQGECAAQKRRSEAEADLDRKLGTKRFRYCPWWNQSRPRISKFGPVPSESMGWSGSKRKDYFMWRVGNEKWTLPRKSRNNAKKLRNYEESVAQNQIEPEHGRGVRRESKSSSIQPNILIKVLEPWTHYVILEELKSHNGMMDYPTSPISEMHQG